MMPSTTQREVTSKAVPPVEVCVVDGGVDDDNSRKSVELEEDEEKMTVQK